MWDVVQLQQSGAAALRDAYCAASVDCGTSPDAPPSASLRVFCALDNMSSADQLEVTLQASVLPPGASQPLLMGGPVSVRLAARSGLDAVAVALDWPVPQPQLWWPLGMGGAQPRYQVTVTASVAGAVSDVRSVWVGLRSLEVPIDPLTRSRVFIVNGVRLFIRGANYITSDHQLRPFLPGDGDAATSTRAEREVRLLAGAGLNMLRVWGGCASERDDFYEACDQAGMLVWQETWISGDCNGRGIGGASPAETERNYPLDHPLFLASAAALIRRLRSRACLAMWCGGNEQTPADDLDAALRALLGPGGQLDAQRLYVSGSMWDGFASGTGSFSDGPYGCIPLEDMFQETFYPYGFNPEAGAAGVPVVESLCRALPDPAQAEPPRLAWAVPGAELTEIPNPAWERHCFEGHGTQLLRFCEVDSMGGGAPAQLSLEAYCETAQVVAYEQWRGLLESYGGRAWRAHSGLLLWKAHNPMPSFRSALYDFFHDVGGGLAAAAVTLAHSPHCQLNAQTREAVVFVSSGVAATALPGGRAAVVDAVAYALDGSVAWSASSAPLQLPSPRSGGGPMSTGLVVPPFSAIVFLRLQLRDEPAETAGRNVYWLHPDASSDAFRPLQAWRQSGRAAVTLKLLSLRRGAGASRSGTVAIKCLGPTVAFFLRLSLRKGAVAAARRDEAPRGCFPWCARGGSDELDAPLLGAGRDDADEEADDRVLPVFWSGNYLTLAPGEELSVAFEFEEEGAVRLRVSGWNLAALELPL